MVVSMGNWSFLTKHGRVLLCIARDPGVRLREIAAELDMTERSAYAIVGDLAASGYVLKERNGRRNRYVIQRHLPLPENSSHDRTIGEVLDDFLADAPRRAEKSA
jgi:DNA-binding IclR family transcriptional regulator